MREGPSSLRRAMAVALLTAQALPGCACPIHGATRALAVAAAAILVSCTPTSRAVVEQAVENVKVSENAKARLALQAACAMTVGAKNRVLSEDEKRHVEALCGGDTERPVTVEDLRSFLATPR